MGIATRKSMMVVMSASKIRCQHGLVGCIGTRRKLAEYRDYAEHGAEQPIIHKNTLVIWKYSEEEPL